MRRRVSLPMVDAAIVARFMRERAHGLTEGVSLGKLFFPAFKPGEKSGVRAHVTLNYLDEEPVCRVPDKYGNGEYSVFDIRKTTRIHIVTHCGSTFTATAGADDTYQVTIVAMHAGNLTTWWGGDSLPWEEDNPAPDNPLDADAVPAVGNA